MVKSVNPTEHTLKVKWLLFTRKFTLGDKCTYSLVDKPSGAITDLHPGQKVTVSYQDVGGVLAADRVQQKPMDYTGTVKSIYPDNHTLTVRAHTMDKTFQLAANCAVILHGGKVGTLSDVRPGHHVTVLYETPNGQATARQISQTSAEYTGSLTAIDLNNRTLKANAMFGSKQFSLADNCSIMVNGKSAKMRDLKPGDKLTFSYNEVNGVNVANCIANTQKTPEAMTAQSNQ